MLKRLVAAGLFLAACGGGGGGGGGVPDTTGEVCTDIAAAMCAKTAECDNTVDEDACNTQFHDFCCGTAGTCDTALPADQVPTQTQYEACLNAYNDLTCEQVANNVCRHRPDN